MTQDDTHYHYPHATQAARQFADALDGKFDTVSPLTEVATVADTSFHLATGYVQATGRKGPIQVIGVPLNTVCPGMDIFVRQMTQSGISQYVFDGYAPATLNMRTSSGSLADAGGNGIAAVNAGFVNGFGVSPPITLPASAYSVPRGWFLSFFFYMPSLPSSSTPATLLSVDALTYNSGTNTWSQSQEWLSVSYNYKGQLGANVYGGYVPGKFTTQTFAPHRIWFVVLQLGNGLAVNGSTNPATMATGMEDTSRNYTPLQSAVTSYFWLNFLGANKYPDAANNNIFVPVSKCPAGTWISKVTFGCSASGGGATAVWPYPVDGTIPQSDSAIVTGNATLGSGLNVISRFLISDNFSSGGHIFLPDTGTAASNNTVLAFDGDFNSTAGGVILTQGPY